MKPQWPWLSPPALAGVFLCVLLSACATPQASRLDQHWPPELASQAQIDRVAFIAQDDYECGPAALAMVMQSAGVKASVQALVTQVYLPGRKGSLQQELLAATRRYGLLAYPLQPELGALLQEVAAGNPVLVFQNLGLPLFPVWHYAVVIGFDRERNVIKLHSGRTEGLTMSLFTFERTWARAGAWSMVALPPEQLPITAQADNFAQSASALERTNPRAAQTAYTRALQQWPQHRFLLLGAGNTAYALGDLEAAQKAYQRAVQLHPEFADAWNNLAQVFLEQGNKTSAAQAIGKAVALAGPGLPSYLELQQTIAKQ